MSELFSMNEIDMVRVLSMDDDEIVVKYETCSKPV